LIREVCHGVRIRSSLYCLRRHRLGADTKHDICVQAAGSERRELTCIVHEPGQIESWACSLRERFGGYVAVALELTKGPIVYALQKYDFIVLLLFRHIAAATETG
jgi:hypothetical protein